MCNCSLQCNATIYELRHQILKLELQLDIYIPLYYSLVVVLLSVALFCIFLVCPARRRHQIKQAVGVKHEACPAYRGIQNVSCLFTFWKFYKKTADCLPFQKMTAICLHFQRMKQQVLYVFFKCQLFVYNLEPL